MGDPLELNQGFQALRDRLRNISDKLKHGVGQSSYLSDLNTKNLIISTGDISDVDGFIALAKYAQSGADVLFIMNYPAYLDPRMGGTIKKDERLTEDDKSGLGFNFTTQQYLHNTPYLKLISKYQPDTGDTLPELWMKRIFTDLGFTIATNVWNATNTPTDITKGNLYFYVGGINTISPFSVNASKNEISVYADCLLQSGTMLPSCSEGITYNQNKERVDLDVVLNSSKEIYMDFNGSMAFYDDGWRGKLKTFKLKLKAVFVMGGVLSDAESKTAAKIKNVLNRFSCATMNQLYSPDKTSNFFQDIKQMNIPMFVITNNAVHDLGKTRIWEDFIRSNGIYSDFLKTIAAAYYTSGAQKVFDFYTALALTEYMKGVDLKGDTNLLYFDSTYGLCVIGNNYRSWKEIIGDYYSHLDLNPSNADDPFIRNKKLNLIEEKEKLTMYSSTSSITVQVLSFDLVDSVLSIK